MPDHQADVLVVGAGPAGSALATVLAREGHDVMLVDRAVFPRPKPCGEFVNPGALAALGRLGFDSSVAALGPARIGGWTIRSERGVPARGRYGSGIFGFGIARTELDDALLRLARGAGARVCEGVNVLRADRAARGDRWELQARDVNGRPLVFRCGFLIGADGLRSRLARQLGAVRRGRSAAKLSLTCHVSGRGPDPDTGHLLVEDRLTVGLACTHSSGERWNVTVVVDPERWRERVSRDGLGVVREMLARVPVEWESKPEITAGPWTSGPFDWRSERIAGPRHLFVGDAAGYYDPLTGQGICRALRSIEIAAPLVLDVVRDPARGWRAARSYGQEVLRDRRGGRRVQHAIESTLHRGWARRSAMARLAAGPDRLGPLLRVTGDVAPARTLVRPAAWRPLLAPRPARPKRSHAYG